MNGGVKDWNHVHTCVFMFWWLKNNWDLWQRLGKNLQNKSCSLEFRSWLQLTVSHTHVYSYEFWTRVRIYTIIIILNLIKFNVIIQWYKEDYHCYCLLGNKRRLHSWTNKYIRWRRWLNIFTYFFLVFNKFVPSIFFTCICLC